MSHILICTPFFLALGRPQIIAISLETAIQNTGIAYSILTLSFPSPLSEIGLVLVISFFFCSTGPILLVMCALYEAYKRVFSRPPSQDAPPESPGGADLALVDSPAEGEKMAVQDYRDVVHSAI